MHDLASALHQPVLGMNANLYCCYYESSIWRYRRAGVRSLLFDCYLEIDNHTKKAVNEKAPNTMPFIWSEKKKQCKHTDRLLADAGVPVAPDRVNCLFRGKKRFWMVKRPVVQSTWHQCSC